MDNRLLKTIMDKKLPQDEADYLLELVGNFPEKEWVLPTNRNNQYFTAFDRLFQLGLVAKRVTPRWKSGVFKGEKIHFQWSNDMIFIS